MWKYLEKLLPLGFSIIFVLVISLININSIINMKDIILSIITFVSILIGFLTTMLSVLITAIDKGVMQYLKKIKRIKDLYCFLSIPILVGFVLIITCLLCIPISDVSNIKSYPNYYFLGFLLMYFVLSCIRAVSVLLLLLFKFIDEDNNHIIENDDLDLSNAFKYDKKQ
ncbi:hypothetical protein [Clostridium sp. VAP51]|uniref:hypothetical protein n=1 Tax=Clostridium sp. VAP51 TaxID=2949978 RepID=UPI00207971DC|nr:hypothetical protein [Clostridium sp. VAP51]